MENESIKRELALEEVMETQALVAHTCNLSCSEGRDKESCSTKPATGK
jgi:hypothetical protein